VPQGKAIGRPGRSRRLMVDIRAFFCPLEADFTVLSIW